jgi:four helix bundle protein
MHKFKDLKVWQKSVELATDIYKLTSTYPSEEKFGLISQMRRCVVSIASNIAEGAGRNTKKDFSNFLSIACGSCCELNTQLVISHNLNYITQDQLKEIDGYIEEIQKMLFSLKNTLV